MIEPEWLTEQTERRAGKGFRQRQAVITVAFVTAVLLSLLYGIVQISMLLIHTFT